MATANEELLDRSISHQVGLLRLSSGIRDKVVAHLNRVEDDLLSQIRDRLEAGSYTDRRQRKVLADIQAILRNAQSDTLGVARDELQDAAQYEADFQQRMIQGAAPVELSLTQPTAEQLRAIVTSQPFRGKLLREWVADLTDAQRRNLRDAVRLGMTEGESVDQIVRRVRGTRANGFKDGVMETTRRHAQAMVRTATNHTATNARDALYRENSDIVKGWMFVATLDTRTSDVCAGLDGREFAVGEGPRPPRHPNCRSATTPVLRSWREMGVDIDEAPAGTRASMDGQVPDKTTYNEWLKRQSAERQAEALGDTKAKLFREGNLEVSQFTDRQGDSLTLDQLRRRESQAFEAAGL